MTIFLCIDLMDSKAVQLVKGKEKKVEIDDVMKLADVLSQLDEPIDVIDLDAAMGKGDNLALIKKLCAKMRCRVGGGIRSIEKAMEVIKAGAKKVIIGTMAFKEGKINADFLTRLKDEISKDRIIISVDSKGGKIVDKGWVHSTGINTLDVVKGLEDYCSEIFYTYVDKEGMMQGTDFETVKKIRNQVDIEVTAGGGIGSVEEIKKLDSIGVNSIVGMAYYTGRISMEELLALRK